MINLALIADRPQWENKPGLLSVEPIHQDWDPLLISSPTNLVPPFLPVPVSLGVPLALKNEWSVFDVTQVTGLVLGKVAAEFDLAPQVF